MPQNTITDRSIFLAAIEIAAQDKRDAFVAQACGENAKLLADVQALLLAHRQSGDLLDVPEVIAGTSVQFPLERSGTQIGPYKLLQKIGEGGMGVVYMAEQILPVQRRVALKLIKAGMDSGQVIARFEAERQALAIMDHPNIAKVLDAGTTESGRPYFVMELVNGIPVTQFCDEQHLTTRERLELFVPICQAVQHAHQKGIIHRDIKPSNILVALYDGRPVPKVIDFGVAKATSGRLTEKTMFTGLGQMVGTIAYMSPEQAQRNQLDVDTRSDVYSLGVVLYELLTGDTPFDKIRLQSAAIDELLRIIREEDPPKPSTKLSSSEALPSVAANRNIEPANLSALVRGELDWIVMKALEKDRGRRYETANSFADDVLRYLNDEPVEACPPSTWYQLQKLAQRHRVALAISGLVLLFLVLLGTSIGWAVRDRAARDEQAAREFSARQVKASGQLDRILDEVTHLEKAEKWPAALVSARSAQPLLASDEAPADIREQVRKKLAELEFVQKLDDIRAEGGSVWGEPRLDNMTVADRNYELAFREFGIDLEALSQVAAVDQIKSRRSILPAVITAIDDWVTVRNLSKGGIGTRRLVGVINAVDTDPWRQQLRIALASKDWSAVHRLASSADLDRQSAGTLYVLGATLYGAGESSLEIDILRRAQWNYPGDYWINHRLGVSLVWTKSPDRVAEGIGYLRAAIALQPERAHAMMNLGNGHQFVGRNEEAEVCFRRAIELDPKSGNCHLNLGNALSGQGKFDEAVAAYRKSIELKPKYASAYINLGNIYKTNRHLDEAVAAFRKAIEVDPKFAAAHNSLGTALFAQGKFDEANAAYRKAIELDPRMAAAHSNLGNSLPKQGKLDEAIACYRRAIELDPKLANAYMGLGNVLREQGKLSEAIAALKKAVEVDPELATAHTNLGNILKEQGKPGEAIAAHKKAIELNPKLAEAHSNLGNALSELGKLDEAIASYKKAFELDPTHVASRSNLGATLATQGKLDEAIAYFRMVIKVDPSFAQAHFNLGSALSEQGKLEEAVASLKKAIELDPKLDAYGSIGNVLWRQGKPSEAVVYFRKAIELKPNDADAHGKLGACLSEQGRGVEAIACFRKAVELNPNNAATHHNLGLALRGQRKLDEAIASFRKAIELDPKLALANNNLGSVLLDQGKLDEAIVCCRRAIELDPKLAQPHTNLGAALHKQGNLDEAVACYRKAIELDPKLADAHRNLGSALQDRGQEDEAIACYRKTIELNPKDAKAHDNLGVALYRQGKIGAATAYLRKSVELDPKNALAQSNLGGALALQGKLEEAIACFRKAVELRPKDAVAYRDLGSALQDQNMPDEAIASFRKAIELDPQFAITHYMLGNVLSGHNRLDEAIASYKKAVELNPQFAPAHTSLGAGLALQGKLDAAIACHRKAIELDPNYAFAHCNLGSALSRQGKLDESIASHRKGIELDPKNARGHNDFAWLLATCPDLKFRDPQRAVELAVKAVELDPKAASYPNTLGVAHYRAGEWKAAITDFEKSMGLREGGDPNDWFFLAMAHWQLGEKEDARKWYGRAVAWMDKTKTDDDELRRFQEEASQLLKLEGASKPIPMSK